MKKAMSFDKFTALCDRFETYTFRCGNWWPTIEEVQTNLEPHLDKNLEFLIWVAVTAEEPQTPEDIESKRYINTLIYNALNYSE